MTAEIKHMIYSRLSEEALIEILEEMIKLAKGKHLSTSQYYLSHSEVDPRFAEDFEQMIENTDWETYLPSEYHVLNKLLIQKQIA